MDPARGRPTVLAGLRPRSIAFFGVDLTGVRLRASDLDWSFGSGELVRGRTQDLAAGAYRAPGLPGRLEGAAAERFARPPAAPLEAPEVR